MQLHSAGGHLPGLRGVFHLLSLLFHQSRQMVYAYTPISTQYPLLKIGSQFRLFPSSPLLISSYIGFLPPGPLPTSPSFPFRFRFVSIFVNLFLFFFDPPRRHVLLLSFRMFPFLFPCLRFALFSLGFAWLRLTCPFLFFAASTPVASASCSLYLVVLLSHSA